MSPLRHSATDQESAGLATAGVRFVRALAAKDNAALCELLADPVDFEALTPGRHWQATAPDVVVNEVILGKWFGAGDTIGAVESLTGDRLPGREHVSYRLRVRNASGEHLVEQQAYYNTDGERITWMRVLCSGYQRLRG